MTATLMLPATGANGQGVLDPILRPPPPPPPSQPGPGPKQPPPPGRPAPAPAKAPSPGGDGPDPPGAKTVPPDAQRIIRSVRRTGGNNTRKLLDSLQPLLAMGYSQDEAIRLGFGRFPIAGYATYSDDWLAPRFTPYFHLHQGTDIFADCGMPVRAPVDGVFSTSGGGAGGLSAYVRGGGAEYYLAHLQGYARNVRSGQRVKTGDIIGFNGNTGNAVGGPCHVHFEVHPGGGGAVNPKPILDGWLKEAQANVNALIASLERGQPQAVIATGLTRRLADGRDGFLAAPVRPSRAELLWASSASPPGGSLHLAEAEASNLATRIDWEELARRRQAQAQLAQVADARARAMLVPLTTPRLRAALGMEAAGAGP